MDYRTCRSIAGASLLAFGHLLSLSNPADAQSRQVTSIAQSPADDAATKAAFEETLRKPNDPAVLLRYAELAVKAGNLEGAISALERLLLIEADLPRVNLELGVLYFRLGSFEAARGYLKNARDSAKATPEIKKRAEQVLAEVEDKTNKSDWSGEFLFGIRYSTNANSGPSGAIRSFGATTVPTPTVSSRPDFNVLGAAALRHRYDLGTQDNAALETDLSLYGSRQFQVSAANVVLTEVTTGPRSRPFDGWADDISLKPFITGRYLAVDNYTTYWAWGTGIEVTSPITANSLAALTILGRRREFVNNPEITNNSNSTGNEFAPTLEFRVTLTPALSLNFSTSATRYVALVASES
ncbi:MAG: tetratricopeptide repeat protein [Acidimicrobiia bacterium]